jgi:uncharacterized transporter YbjL
MIFTLVALGAMFFVRKIGWYYSRAFLYRNTALLAVILCVVWGLLIASGVRALIEWQQPHWALKWVFGFALGAYTSVPNLGLANRDNTPEGRDRHRLILLLPLGAYLTSSAILAFLR